MESKEMPPSEPQRMLNENAGEATRIAWRNIQYSIYGLILVLSAVFVFSFFPFGNTRLETKETTSITEPGISSEVIDGKDSETGLIAADGWIIVKQNCTRCHSSKLIVQNHLSRERWEKSIRWMQKNQNLGDLGENETVILDYLEKHYGPTRQGRRKGLEKQNWYYLK